ncbi:transcriptional regulator, ArsR family [Colwellia chukchiensis]|uniref:Transcriptional regulator, ArsR family n=1 Tax=Colwellia chukchiensis TaxID=641665 RepID=A0A1H7G7L1_9GAMM|nr:metalloregulator ArsR/SmtB family transcription factor [Colwellia chukchiensis]SEK32450.1 transcriptional regulator, ArsR family [Colwellia chukchiensis]
MLPSVFFKQLSDDIRLRCILLIAQEGELCVCELMVALAEPSQPKISRHLALLKNAGLLVSRKQQQWVYYDLNPAIEDWAQQVIVLTLQDNLHFIAQNVQALHEMGTRPARLTSCCT